MENDRLASTSKPVRIGLWGSPSSGKTTFLAALWFAVNEAGRPSIRSVRRDTAELDRMLAALVSTEAFPSPWYRDTTSTAPDSRIGPADLPAAAGLTAPSAIPSVGAADHPWTSSLALSFSVVSLPLSDQLILSDPARPSQRGTGGPAVFAPDWRLADFVLEIDDVLLPYFRHDLIRLIYGVRSILRLILIRVLSALSRCPGGISAVLVLLAASRCFGYRTEPGDCAPPVLTSKSVVIGEAARLC